MMPSIAKNTQALPEQSPVDIQVSRWMHAPCDFSLSHLRGKVVLVHTFQMLCPGCVLQAIPQVARLQALGFPDLAIIGLHTVFEHHHAMSDAALEVFLDEFRIDYPVGVDLRIGAEAVPRTMRSLALRGTPSTLLLDRNGCLREQRFGMIDDLALGCLIGSLLAEDSSGLAYVVSGDQSAADPVECSTGVCRQADSNQ